MATTYTIDFTDTAAKTSFNIPAFATDGPVSPNDATLESRASAAHTTLLLHGKGTPDYGEQVDENLIHLLENFASDTSPVFPTAGQLWFDTTEDTIKVYDGTLAAFKSIHAIFVGVTPPASPTTGELWYDTSGGVGFEQLKIWTPSSTWLSVADLYVLRAGDTVTGQLLLDDGVGGPQTPTDPRSAVNKDYVDTLVGGVNELSELLDVNIAGGGAGGGNPPTDTTRFLKASSAVSPYWTDSQIFLSDVQDVTATFAEVNFLSGVTSNVQTQLNNRLLLDASNSPLTGFLLLNADPVSPTGAATKQYVDAASGSDGVVTDGFITDSTSAQTLTLNTSAPSSVVIDITHTHDAGSVSILSLFDQAPTPTNIIIDTPDFPKLRDVIDINEFYFAPRISPTIDGQAALSTSLDIQGASAGSNGTFTINGDWTSLFTAGFEFTVSGSTSNDGTYVTSSSATGTGSSGFQTVKLNGGALEANGAPGGASYLVRTTTPEVTSITAVADVSGSLNNTYFLLNSPTTLYYVWYNVGGGGTDPLLAGRTGIAVAVATNAIDTAVASATQSAIDALGDFGASVISATVTVTNAADGNVESAEDGAVPTNFSFAVSDGIGVVATSTTGLQADTAGFQIADVGGSQLAGSVTGLANDATVYTADINVDGGGNQPIAVTGSTAQTYFDLVGQITADLTGAVAVLEGGNIKVRSSSVGSTSTIVITDTDLFSSLSAFVALNTPVAGFDSVTYTASIDVDTTPNAISIDGNNAPRYAELITELDTDLTGASSALVDGNLQITSASTGGSSSILITDSSLFFSLIDRNFTRFAIDGQAQTDITVSTTVPSTTGVDGLLTWTTVPTLDTTATNKKYVDDKNAISRSLDVAGGTSFTTPTYDLGANNLWVFHNGLKLIKSFAEVTNVTVTNGASFSGVGAGEYFTISSPSIHYVWYNVSGGNSDPAPTFSFGQVWQVDVNTGPTFVDETADANSAATNDWQIFPAVEEVGDYVALGFGSRFGSVTLDNTSGVAGVGGVVVWEYWNGTAWTALGGLSDGTTGFTAAVSSGQVVSWTIPSDWRVTSLNGESELYYVRARVTTVYTTNPVYDVGVINATGVTVAVTAADTAVQVAIATASAIDGTTGFGATSFNDVVTVTNDATGPAIDAADGTTGTFTFSVTQQGSTNDYEEATSTSITTNFTVTATDDMEFLVVGRA